MTLKLAPSPRPPAAATSAALEVREASVLRGGTAAVSGASFDVAAGEAMALVGPNGGGKTSLLRAIVGLENLAAGEIRLAGHAPTAAAGRGDVVGYVPQRPAAPTTLPIVARQVVRMAVPRGGDAAWADEALARVGADDLADAPVSRLSGGQLQQVFLARAIANRPRVLLLDEPTVGLDRGAINRLVGLLGDLRAEAGMACVIATHDHLTAMDVARRLVYLDRTVRYAGPADALPPDLDARLCHHGRTARHAHAACGRCDCTQS